MAALKTTNFRYQDNLAAKRHRRSIAKVGVIVLIVFAVFAGGVYAVFFSPIFQIQKINLSNVKTIDPQVLLGQVQSVLDQKRFGYIPWNRNIFFLDTGKISDILLSDHPELKSVKITKNIPKELYLSFNERSAIGIWCFGNDTSCVYFDNEGRIWGQAPSSSGSLLIVVHDQRGPQVENSEQGSYIDKEFLVPIQAALQNISLTHLGARSVTIFANSFREFRLETNQGYPLLMGIDSHIVEQLKALKLLLDKKGVSFYPQYIDLRIDGRIYYK